MRFNGKLFHLYRKQICFCSFTLFYIFYAFPQIYFSIFVENIFNKNSKKQNKILYYLIITLQGIIIIFTFITLFFMASIIIHEPFVINSLSPILNEIGSIDLISFYILLAQIVVQLEFSPYRSGQTWNSRRRIGRGRATKSCVCQGNMATDVYSLRYPCRSADFRFASLNWRGHYITCVNESLRLPRSGMRQLRLSYNSDGSQMGLRYRCALCLAQPNHRE